MFNPHFATRCCLKKSDRYCTMLFVEGSRTHINSIHPKLLFKNKLHPSWILNKLAQTFTVTQTADENLTLTPPSSVLSAGSSSLPPPICPSIPWIIGGYHLNIVASALHNLELQFWFPRLWNYAVNTKCNSFLNSTPISPSPPPTPQKKHNQHTKQPSHHHKLHNS